ncbi:hypothetical protein OAO87_01690 [bacterium]|nr:hypothetical protein [bacterium]
MHVSAMPEAPAGREWRQADSRPPHALTHGRTRLTREPSGAIVAHLHPRLARRAARRVAHERSPTPRAAPRRPCGS